MKKREVIHKANAGVFTFCTGKLDETESHSKLSQGWGKVTCKHCLKLKGKKKLESHSAYISRFLRANNGFWS